MASPGKPTTPAQKAAAAKFSFKLESNVPVPVRASALPDYGIEELLESAAIGQSVLLEVTTVPVEHARTLAATINRAWKKAGAVFNRLPDLQKEVRELRAEGAQLRNKPITRPHI